MRPSKYFHDKPLHKYLDSKTVLIYHPHPVQDLYYVHVYRIIVLLYFRMENFVSSGLSFGALQTKYRVGQKSLVTLEYCLR